MAKSLGTVLLNGQVSSCTVCGLMKGDCLHWAKLSLELRVILDSQNKYGQALGVGDGQGSLACCSPRGCKESDTTERLNSTEQGPWLMPVCALARTILECGLGGVASHLKDPCLHILNQQGELSFVLTWRNLGWRRKDRGDIKETNCSRMTLNSLSSVSKTH